MSVETAVTGIVSSYIAAMYKWETEAEREAGGSVMQRVEQMERMTSTGEAEALESARQCILAQHCTPQKRISRGCWGTTPQHHPELERITQIQQISDTKAHAWTDYTDSQGFQTRRRYELQLCEGTWLIEQHYVLREAEEFAEIF
jgi:hypothetical protein